MREPPERNAGTGLGNRGTRAGVAQLVEHKLPKFVVASSSLAARSIFEVFGAIAQLGER